MGIIMYILGMFALAALPRVAYWLATRIDL